LKKVKGYSLIETIVALAIASLLVMGFYSLSNSLLKARDSSRIAQKALTLAENRIESILAEPDNLSVSPSGVFITYQEVDGFIVAYRILSGADDAVVSDEAGEVARLYTIEVIVTYGTFEKSLSTKYYAFRE
jgi:prepilin-type N-terminal cleavage/methylation domain-containing protein